MNNFNNEIWKTIYGYEDYQVSNHGRVKSLERVDNLGKTVKERILKQVNNKGYQQVMFCKDGKRKSFLVHRLVANAFIDNPNNLPQVNHIDEVKTNNHVSNLEWCDCKYNCNYGTRNERQSKALRGENSPMFEKFGKEHPKAKQVIQLTLDNQFIKTWGGTREIQRELGYNQGNISSCCSGRYKTSNGYKWCYA